MEEINVCKECLEQFKKWLLLQAYRDSAPTHTKYRQTRGYEYYTRLEMMKDIKIKE